MANTFTEKCKELGISPSYTRKRIYEYLEASKTHPTVDQIYKDLVDELPTLSKTTVYNVLNLFIEHRLVDPINTSNNEKRYEIRIEKHSHFTCTICQKIYDIPEVNLSYSLKDISGFQVDHEEVTLYGVCPSCQEKK